MSSSLSRAISNALSQVGATAPGLYFASRVSTLYEGFIFACIIESLTHLRARLQACDENDRPTRTFTFKTKPSLIYTSGLNYVLVSVGSRNYELHTNLRVLGYSGALHELDVMLLKHETGRRCRLKKFLPGRGSVRLLVECKFYGGTRLPLHLGREYLGLSSEFKAVRIKTIASNIGSHEIHVMITAHHGTENFYVSPRAPENVRRFVEWMANELHQVL